MKVLARQLGVLVAALTVVLVAFYLPWLTGRSTFYIYDFYTQWHPMLTFIGSQLREGRLPLWNPYVLNGIPQSFFPSIFYPLNWLFLLPNVNLALAIMFIVHHLVAAVGMFLLMETLGFGAAPAAFGAIAMALSASLFSLQVTYPMQGAFAWFPLSLWSIRWLGIDCSERKRVVKVVTAAFIMYCHITAGMPEVFTIGMAIALATTIILFCQHARPRLRRALVIGCARLTAIGCSVLLSAPLLVPAAEWAKLSPRAGGLPLSDVLRYSANWYELLCVFVSQPLGDLYRMNPYRQLLAPLYMPGNVHDFTPFMASIYLSPIVIAMALFGLLDRTWKERWVMLAFIGFFGYLSCGFNAPYVVNLLKLTHLTSFRFPSKLLVWVVFAMIVLAARGGTVLYRNDYGRSLWTSVSVWSVIFLASAALAIAAKFGVSFHAGAWQQPVLLLASAIALSSAAALLVCWIYKLRLEKRFSARTAIGLLSALMIAMLLANAWQFNWHPGTRSFYRKPPAVAQAIGTGSNRLPRDAYLVLGTVPYNSRDVDLKRLADAAATPDELPFQYKRQLMVPMTNVEEGIGCTRYAPTGQTADNAALWNRATDEYRRGNMRPLATLCRITYTQFVTTLIRGQLQSGAPYAVPDMDPRWFQLAWQDPRLNVRLWRVAGAGAARAYFPQQVKWARPHAAVLDYISSSADFDPLKLTLLEHNSLNEHGPLLAQHSLRDVGTVSVKTDLPMQIVLDANTPVDNFLVLTDSFYPGWKASVDGKPAPIVKANAIVRAVFVPAGRHRVEFDYEPDSFRLGALVAFLTAAVLMVGLALSILPSWAKRS